jgi:hypothetical protein
MKIVEIGSPHARAGAPDGVHRPGAGVTAPRFINDPKPRRNDRILTWNI